MIKQIIGYSIAASPIIALLVFMGIDLGWLVPVATVGAVVTVIGVMFLGAWIASG